MVEISKVDAERILLVLESQPKIKGFEQPALDVLIERLRWAIEKAEMGVDGVRV